MIDFADADCGLTLRLEFAAADFSLNSVSPGKSRLQMYCYSFGGRRNMKTFMADSATVERKWYVVDATDKTLGRLASEVAKVLRGKNKPVYTPFVDTGDYVIVINAD